MLKTQMKFLKKLVLVFSLLLGLFLLGEEAVYAEGDVGYDIQAVLPENQVDGADSFFNLRMTPSQTQTIEFIINNTSNQPSVYQMSINQAYTNSQGFIDYDKDEGSNDASLKYPINEIAQIESEVSVAANSSVRVPVELTMPAESFDGQILAAIEVIKDTKKNSGGISNSYGYVLGLKLTETDNEVSRDLKLLSVKPAISFQKTSVVANLQNPTMDAYGHLKYDGKVYNRETDELVKKANFDNDMQMAPNSTYSFVIDWKNQPLESGDYRLALKVSDAKGNVWNFKKNFTITAEEAAEVNTVITNQNNQKLPIWLYGLLGVILALLLVIIVFLLLKRRKSEEE